MFRNLMLVEIISVTLPIHKTTRIRTDTGISWHVRFHTCDMYNGGNDNTAIRDRSLFMAGGGLGD